MAITERYFDPDLATGLDDGTSEANAWQTWTSMQAAHVAGERVNAKKTASPYAPGANISFAVNATDLLVSIFRGYGSTIGDGTKFQFDMGATSTLNGTGEGALIQDIDVTGTDISRIVSMSGDVSRIENFKIVNTSTTANANDGLVLADASAFNGYAETNGTAATSTAIELQRGIVYGCEAVSTGYGVLAASSGRDSAVMNCLIRRKGASGGIGLNVTGAAAARGMTYSGNTIDGFTTLISFDGLDDIATAIEHVAILDNILSNATTGISNTDSATKVMAAFLSTNVFYNISGSDMEFGDNENHHDIQLTADPYTNAAGGDYSLNNTAGGGADCRAAGLFSGGVTTNYRDIGALQHQDTGGGGDPFPSQGIQSLSSGMATG